VLTGTVDRIEDDRHIVIIFDAEDRQVVCDAEDLPEEVRHPGAVIEADINEDGISNISYLPEEEKSNRKEIEEKRDRLTEK
jgi:hypothetical protein